MRERWYLNLLMPGIFLLLPLLAYAEDSSPQLPSIEAAPAMPVIQSAPAASPPVEPPIVAQPPEPSLIDSSHDYVSDAFVSVARYIDSFFGTDRSFQENNKSVLQFNVGRVYQNSGSSGFNTSFRAKFHFPALQDRFYQYQKKLHLMLESNPDKNQNLTGGTAQPGRASILREVNTPDTYGVALRFENEDDSPWRYISADGGLKLDNITIRPFLRGRASYSKSVGAVQLKLAESVFWFDNTGVGESTQFDVDHPVAEKLMFRASSGATWMHDRQNFDLRQDFSLYQTLDEKASMLYQTSVIGVTNPQAQVSEYIALILFRQRIHRDWVFLEISPQMHYPRTIDYQPNAQLILGLEVLFSK